MSTIVTQFGDIASAVGELLVKLFTSISSVFWTPAAGESPGQLTFVGVIAIMVLCIGLAIIVLNWIRGLIARR